MATAATTVAEWILLRDAFAFLTEAWQSSDLAKSALTEALSTGIEVRAARLRGRRWKASAIVPKPADFFRPGAMRLIYFETSSARLWQDGGNHTLYLIRMPAADFQRLLPPGYSLPRKAVSRFTLPVAKPLDTPKLIWATMCALVEARNEDPVRFDALSLKERQESMRQRLGRKSIGLQTIRRAEECLEELLLGWTV